MAALCASTKPSPRAKAAEAAVVVEVDAAAVVAAADTADGKVFWQDGGGRLISFRASTAGTL
jgi:succinylarginine dihydrolase